MTSNTEMTSNAEIVHWAVSDSTTSHRWEFSSGIRFESFWKTISAEERDIWQYQVDGKKAALSAEDEFDKIVTITLSSQAQDYSDMLIQKAVEGDFIENGVQVGVFV